MNDPPAFGFSFDAAKMRAAGCTVAANGTVTNSSGYNVCGVLNQHDRPCQRIGRCPFHSLNSPSIAPAKKHEEEIGASQHEGTINASPVHESPILHANFGQHACSLLPSLPPLRPAAADSSSAFSDGTGTGNASSSSPRLSCAGKGARNLPPRASRNKVPYKKGWTKQEHLLFLLGLERHGRGSWKQISAIVRSRTPTQIQSHAQKFFLRQDQTNKNKKSIHDFNLHSPEMQVLAQQLKDAEEAAIRGVPSNHNGTHLFENHGSVPQDARHVVGAGSARLCDFRFGSPTFAGAPLTDRRVGSGMDHFTLQPSHFGGHAHANRHQRQEKGRPPSHPQKVSPLYIDFQQHQQHEDEAQRHRQYRNQHQQQPYRSRNSAQQERLSSRDDLRQHASLHRAQEPQKPEQQQQRVSHGFEGQNQYQVPSLAPAGYQALPTSAQCAAPFSSLPLLPQPAQNQIFSVAFHTVAPLSSPLSGLPSSAPHQLFRHSPSPILPPPLLRIAAESLTGPSVGDESSPDRLMLTSPIAGHAEAGSGHLPGYTYHGSGLLGSPLSLGANLSAAASANIFSNPGSGIGSGLRSSGIAHGTSTRRGSPSDAVLLTSSSTPDGMRAQAVGSHTPLTCIYSSVSGEAPAVGSVACMHMPSIGKSSCGRQSTFLQPVNQLQAPARQPFLPQFQPLRSALAANASSQHAGPVEPHLDNSLQHHQHQQLQQQQQQEQQQQQHDDHHHQKKEPQLQLFPTSSRYEANTATVIGDGLYGSGNHVTQSTYHQQQPHAQLLQPEPHMYCQPAHMDEQTPSAGRSRAHSPPTPMGIAALNAYSSPMDLVSNERPWEAMRNDDHHQHQPDTSAHMSTRRRDQGEALNNVFDGSHGSGLSGDTHMLGVQDGSLYPSSTEVHVTSMVDMTEQQTRRMDLPSSQEGRVQVPNQNRSSLLATTRLQLEREDRTQIRTLTRTQHDARPENHINPYSAFAESLPSHSASAQHLQPLQHCRHNQGPST
jgi:SHAQKYF class myb-like DNA-binding protein